MKIYCGQCQGRNLDISRRHHYSFESATALRSAVRASGDRSYTAWVTIDDSSLLYAPQMSSEAADLIDIGSAIQVADRLTRRKQDSRSDIRVEVPVRNISLVHDRDIREALEEILDWCTGDNWRVTFLPRHQSNRLAQVQMRLPLSNLFEDVAEVCLWSGGLDGFAGLCNRVIGSPASKHLLIGTGGNHLMHSVQRNTAQGFERLFPGRSHLMQIRVRLDHTPTKKCSRPRARGLMFLLHGAACADSLGKDELAVYENGVGAINLPYRASEVGLDHGRSVHPRTLNDVGAIISKVIGRTFRVRNPFVNWTKAQMCRVMSGPDVASAAFRTVSCDQRWRKPPHQCGYCTSCLLRQQAFGAAGIQDRTEYCVTERSGSDLAKYVNRRNENLLAMRSQVDTIRSAMLSASPWQRLAYKYPELSEVADALREQPDVDPELVERGLCDLYLRYSREWN